jgi:hypothetical protein
MLFPIAQPVEIALPVMTFAACMVVFCDWRVGEDTVIPLSEPMKASFS